MTEQPTTQEVMLEEPIEGLNFIVPNANNVLDISAPVDEEFFQAFLRGYATLRRRDPYGRIHVICQGLGGSVNWALPVCNIVAADGNITGWLIGEAQSAHANIFVSCPYRVAIPGAFLGLHSTLSNSQEGQPLREVKTELEEVEMYNELVAARFALAGNRPPSYWKELLDNSPRMTVKITYEQLIEMRLAKPALDLTPLWRRVPVTNEFPTSGKSPAPSGLPSSDKLAEDILKKSPDDILEDLLLVFDSDEAGVIKKLREGKKTDGPAK